MITTRERPLETWLCATLALPVTLFLAFCGAVAGGITDVMTSGFDGPSVTGTLLSPSQQGALAGCALGALLPGATVWRGHPARWSLVLALLVTSSITALAMPSPDIVGGGMALLLALSTAAYMLSVVVLFPRDRAEERPART